PGGREGSPVVAAIRGIEVLPTPRDTGPFAQIIRIDPNAKTSNRGVGMQNCARLSQRQRDRGSFYFPFVVQCRMLGVTCEPDHSIVGEQRCRPSAREAVHFGQVGVTRGRVGSLVCTLGTGTERCSVSRRVRLSLP